MNHVCGQDHQQQKSTLQDIPAVWKLYREGGPLLRIRATIEESAPAYRLIPAEAAIAQYVNRKRIRLSVNVARTIKNRSNRQSTAPKIAVIGNVSSSQRRISGSSRFRMNISASHWKGFRIGWFRETCNARS